MWTKHRSITVWIAFQAVWLVSALSAAAGISWIAVSAAGLFVATVLALDGWPRSLMTTAVASGALGVLVEGTLSVSGFVRYGAAWPAGWPAPLWIVLLWCAFGITLAPLGSLLGSSWLLSGAALGLVFGPLAYLAGERLGALTIGTPVMLAYAAVGAAWGLALPLLLKVSRHEASPSFEDPE
jgi:hypothetical protein